MNLDDYCSFSVAICVPLCSAALYRGVQNLLILENTHYHSTVYAPHL